MNTGFVKFFKSDKNYGFITYNEGEDLFFHISSCVDGYENPQKGDKVSFEIGEGRDGRPVAVNVRLVSEEEYSEEEYSEGEE